MEPTDTGPTERTILFVEDNDDVRDFVTIALDGAGYEVLAHSRGEEALADLDKRDGDVSLVILDRYLEAGGLSSEDTYLRIRKRSPTLPVLLVSGDGEADARKTFPDLEPKPHFLQKPFTGTVLLQRMQEIFALGGAD